MSAGAAAAAPDLVAPVLGFRAWRVDRRGRLHPYAIGEAEPWAPGVNDARCHRREAGGVLPRHAPPVQDCMCGLYALATLADPRLSPIALEDGVLVGAVAAWGEMEVHRAGFRAAHACVLALADPVHHLRARARAAAARHGVDLVPRGLLALTAGRYAQPVPESLMPRVPRRRRRGGVPGSSAVGVAADDHLWVSARAVAVTVGIAAPLAEALGRGPVDLVLPEPGRVVARGDVLGSVAGADGRRLVLAAPFSGTLEAVNPRLPDEPGLLVREHREAGWLARIRPARWAEEAPGIDWGPAGRAAYLAAVAAARERGHDPLATLHEEHRTAAARIGSWADLRAVLRARRERPRFADGAQAAREIGRALAERLADPARAARVARLGERVLLDLREPEARLVLDARAPAAALGGDDGPAPGLTISGRAEAVADWLTGALDPAAALRRGDLVLSAPRAEAAAALGLLAPLVAPTGAS